MTSWKPIRTSQPFSAIWWGDGRGQLCEPASPCRLAELRSRPHARVSDAAGGRTEENAASKQPGDAEAGPPTTLVTSESGSLCFLRAGKCQWESSMCACVGDLDCMPCSSVRGISRKEYWLYVLLKDLQTQGSNLSLLHLLGGRRFLTTSATWKPSGRHQ